MKALDDKSLILEANELKDRLYFIRSDLIGYLNFVKDANKSADATQTKPYNYAIQRIEHLVEMIDAARMQTVHIESLLRNKQD